MTGNDLWKGMSSVVVENA